ncbi:unnamed protein product [Owenia fusiformis]|uniref:Uncharacterized protein n=1 Tax=Owenia fusiformis TaxID=6347 RepID=A0A8J1U173_OWEFU|nr:unnamed protein product [Owenia fusiformis]
MSHNTIHWFRKGLRLHDNLALLEGIRNSAEWRAVFVLDPWFVQNAKVGPNRWRFLMQCLEDLNNSLNKLGSRLFVIRGNPNEVFPKLFKKWEITQLTFEVDTEPYAKQRDQTITDLAKKHQIDVLQRVSHTLYDTKQIIKKNGGSAPGTYQRCLTVMSQLGAPPQPEPTLSKDDIKGCKLCMDACGFTADIPTLEELNVKENDLETCLYVGGESEALKRLDKYMTRQQWVCNFEKPKTEPNSINPSTTVLSPYLKFGCLSARTFYHRLNEIYRHNKKHSGPPVSLEGQLYWREFFTTVGSDTPNFDKMVGNPICRQIPWDDNTQFLEAWKHGKTGYPFIDAIMVQLRREGWIHHLARHAVACFLTRGDLWISWEEGQKVFEELLLDADWSLNAGNWMWLSASAFFHQYFRVYSPVAFGKKTDKNGDFIRKYLPVLQNFPAQYIYEPWKAPLKVQEKFKCIIGKDYPKPIVDHDVVRQLNIKKMAAAYAKNKEAKEESPKKKKQKVK